MEFDNLKNAWQDDQPDAIPEISLEKQKQIRLPLEKIRKNMKMEFCLNVFSIIIFAPVLYYIEYNYFVKWTLYLVFLFIVAYYTIKFYKLYKSLTISDLSAYNQLLEVKYELKLNIELYKSYYVCMVPYLMAMLFFFFKKEDFFEYDDLIMHYAPFIIFFVVCAITLAFGAWWLEYYYGKYVKKIEKSIGLLQ